MISAANIFVVVALHDYNALTLLDGGFPNIHQVENCSNYRTSTVVVYSTVDDTGLPSYPPELLLFFF